MAVGVLVPEDDSVAPERTAVLGMPLRNLDIKRLRKPGIAAAAAPPANDDASRKGDDDEAVLDCIAPFVGDSDDGVSVPEPGKEERFGIDVVATVGGLLITTEVVVGRVSLEPPGAALIFVVLVVVVVALPSVCKVPPSSHGSAPNSPSIKSNRSVLGRKY